MAEREWDFFLSTIVMEQSLKPFLFSEDCRQIAAIHNSSAGFPCFCEKLPNSMVIFYIVQVVWALGTFQIFERGFAPCTETWLPYTQGRTFSLIDSLDVELSTPWHSEFIVASFVFKKTLKEHLFWEAFELHEWLGDDMCLLLESSCYLILVALICF